MDHGGIEGDGIAQILAGFDHLHHEGLAGRHVEGVDEALGQAQPEDVRDGDGPAQGQHRQRERLEHRKHLRDHEGGVPVPPIDPYSSKRRQKERWDLSGKAHHSQQKRRVGEAVHQPSGSDAGHPSADQREALAAEKQTVVAVPQGADHQRPVGIGLGCRHRDSLRGYLNQSDGRLCRRCLFPNSSFPRADTALALVPFLLSYLIKDKSFACSVGWHDACLDQVDGYPPHLWSKGTSQAADPLRRGGSRAHSAGHDGPVAVETGSAQRGTLHSLD